MSTPPRTYREKRMRWRYDPCRNRTKHKSNRSESHVAFVGKNKTPVGKCGKDITMDLAQRLLNEGIPDNKRKPKPGSDCPSTIFNVYNGIVFAAKSNNACHGYHGYPYRGDLRVSIFHQLENRARENGWEREFKRWADEHLNVQGR